MSVQPVNTAFVDRDGVINALSLDHSSGRYESPLRLDQVVLLPRAGDAIHSLNTAGWRVVCVTNQPAAAKGTAEVATLRAIHTRVLELLSGEGAVIDHSEICFHHPDGVDPELSVPCDCRKPAPGMLFHAAAALGFDTRGCWMIGDSDSDVEAGQRAGCRTVIIEHTLSGHRRGTSITPDYRAETLLEAVQMLLAREAHC